MDTLSSGDILEIISHTGITHKQFYHWCAIGVVPSSNGARGSGNHRRFTIMQALGILVAANVYQGERGCKLTYVSKIIKHFSIMSEEEFMRQPDIYDEVDIKSVWNGMLDTIKEIRTREHKGQGRVRGGYFCPLRAERIAFRKRGAK